MMKTKYPACWYCDNIIDHPEQIGLLYLGFPRCFVLIKNDRDFIFSTYEQFVKNIAEVNWLDPADIERYSEQEKEDVLIALWNFSVEQERKEDELCNER